MKITERNLRRVVRESLDSLYLNAPIRRAIKAMIDTGTTQAKNSPAWARAKEVKEEISGYDYDSELPEGYLAALYEELGAGVEEISSYPPVMKLASAIVALAKKNLPEHWDESIESAGLDVEEQLSAVLRRAALSIAMESVTAPDGPGIYRAGLDRDGHLNSATHAILTYIETVLVRY